MRQHGGSGLDGQGVYGAFQSIFHENRYEYAGLRIAETRDDQSWLGPTLAQRSQPEVG